MVPLCLMVSIGYRTGLFDVMRDRPPSTSAEIAACANLNEHYVREWLGAMTTGGVMEVDPETSRFSLPAEHAAYFTRAPPPTTWSPSPNIGLPQRHGNDIVVR
jgi:hypothetical protein